MRDLKKLAIENNIWFTDDEIKEFRNLRKQREQEQKRKVKERDEKENRNKEKEANEDAAQIGKIKEEYKECIKDARKENKSELNGMKNVPIEGRKRLIGLLGNWETLNLNITNEAIEITVNTLCIYPDLATKECIKALIAGSYKNGGIQSVDEVTNELINSLKRTEFYRPLSEYKTWLIRERNFKKAKDMKDLGMTNMTIGSNLGISSAEVSKLLKNNRNLSFPKFGGSDDR